MRRTVLSALALAATAVLAGAVPAFADGASQAPAPASGTADPTQAPTAKEPTQAPTPVPADAEPTQAPARAADAEPSQAPARVADAEPSQVPVVPKGAPDTGAAPASASAESGIGGGLIGGGAAAAFAVGGATFLLVRRGRTTGA
ncbi:sortase-dependent protein [Streptomyces sp. NPDC050509]|uniref:sortase-dependent protein n=1 Tax=Streptomyces sp. NPDC050509 TaxID=3365620 RepID=UPI0037A352FE